MNYAVDMGSDAMMYAPNFIKIGSGIQKLMGGGILIQTRREQGDLISPLVFFQNKERRLKTRHSCGVKLSSFMYTKRTLS
jgi:hypothetical protein